MKFFFFSAFLVFPLLAFADPVDSGLVSDQTDIQQESIRLQKELKSILAEMEANNLPTQDRATVETLLQSLGKLNDTDMKNVVTLLKSGSSGVDTMTQVFKGQSSIESGLQALADRVSTEDSIETVPPRLEALLERQTGNLRETESLGRIQDAGAAARSPAGEVAATEQQSVGDEMEQVLSLLERKALSDSAAQLSAKLLAAADPTTLRTEITAAPKSLSTAQYPTATASEKAILDTLQKMVAVSDKSQPLTERLQGLHNALSELVADHGKMVDTVNGMPTSDHKVGEVESSLADRANLLRTKAEGLSAAAAIDLAKADDAMNKTADQLSANSWDYHPADAKSGAAESDADLKKALDDVDQQLAQATKDQTPAADTPEQKYAALSKAQAELSDLEKNQAAADPNNAAAQNAVANQAAAVQKDLAAAAPEAAPDAGKAAEASADAGSPSSSAPDKAADSKEAAADIAAAANAVKNDMANIASDYKKTQALKDAAASLDAAASALGRATDNMNANALPQSVPDLKAAGDAVAKSQADTQNAAEGQPGSPDKSGNQDGVNKPDDGQAALAQAGQALKDAENNAVMGKGEESKTAAASAKGKIDEARKALADALDKDLEKTAGGLTGKGADGPAGNTMVSRNAVFVNEDNPVVPDGTAAYGAPQYAGYVDGARKTTMQSLQHEGYPQEYGPLVQQYWKSLATASAKP